MSNKVKKLNLLGLAQAAGQLVSGEGLVIQALQAGQASLVICAQDASERTKKKIKDKCSYYNVPTNFDYTSLEISQALGKKRLIVAFTNQGFAKSFIKD
ncbi:hypothetical protein AWM75_01900 [Aerococcus urinaehominis]|uniref:Uncharacterized protein n=1 Tax=Aerococcus urinaehominis TaxID=128944 RepID=A0A0X8FK77_9LACT|nr:ribosomal L7Ae/L30e/S12e/Gadd45 family protein [Aerococcus urinaehominis]AMB98820.1 hypothetical protein AWM75_01900 [Aerococcus urinaehominis]SDM48960.1 Ribosomal protein L7Ae [Aerococcus urinaehominis]